MESIMKLKLTEKIFNVRGKQNVVGADVEFICK